MRNVARGLSKDPWYQEVGDRLRTAIEKSGLSQIAIAKRMGVHRSQVTRWKKGGVPAQPVRARLAEVLGVQPHELLAGTGAPEEGPPAGKKKIDQALLREYEAVLRPKLLAELRAEIADDLKRQLDKWAKRG